MTFSVFKITDAHLFEEVRLLCNGTETGCYRVFSTGPDGRPTPVRRLLGDDPEGIIYIGSRRLHGRMADLRSPFWRPTARAGKVAAC